VEELPAAVAAWEMEASGARDVSGRREKEVLNFFARWVWVWERIAFFSSNVHPSPSKFSIYICTPSSPKWLWQFNESTYGRSE
jgi:hypothetical protein